LIQLLILAGLPEVAAGQVVSPGSPEIIAGADSNRVTQEQSAHAIPDLRPAGALEPDARFIPWTTLRRLTLEAGQFLPPFGPVARAELATLMQAVAADTTVVLTDPGEQAVWHHLERTLTFPGQTHGDTRVFGGVELGLGAELVQAEYGDVLPDAGGLALPTGWSFQLEPRLNVWQGRWWLGVTARLRGRLDDPQRVPPPLLLYQDWNRATGRLAVGDARLDQQTWRVDWPRIVAGVQLGRWSLTAGVDRRWLGPAISGGLELSRTARVFPALTLRRTAPFSWRGILRHVAPVNLLLRVGSLSDQDISYFEGDERVLRRERPWFFQWLLTFQHTAWLRTTVVSSAMAVARQGTLWPDLLQINFPLLSATPAEVDRGPVTDRIFALQFEARFRNAPWPLLPAAAGRLYWEYGGEDFLPLDAVDFLPRISVPASVAGIELVSPRWDLAAEYAELEHPDVLWYAHGNFQQGYSQQGWVLGHPLGGSGESWRGWLRWRPRGTTWQVGLAGSRSAWGQAGLTPGVARRSALAVCLQQRTGMARWQVGAEMNDEEVTPFGDPGDGPEKARWLRTWLRFTY